MLENSDKRIAKNTIFLYGRMLLVLFVSFYTTRAILNALGVIDFGINNAICGFVSMFSFLSTSMSNSIQRFYNFKVGELSDENAITNVYNTALLIQVIIAFIIVVLLESIGLWYINSGNMIIPADRLLTANCIYQFSAFSLVLVIIQTPYSAAIMAYEKMDYFAIVNIIEALLRLCIALIIPYVNSDKLFWFGVLTLAISCLTFLLYFFYCKFNIPQIKVKSSFNKILFKDMISFSGWNIFGTFAYMLKGQGLNVLLNAFFGPAINAARGIAYQIMGAIQGFSSNIVISFRPQLVQSYAQGDLKRTSELMFSSTKISYLLLMMLSIPISTEIDYILNWWLKGNVPDYTIPFTILVLANMAISSLNTPLTQVVHATGNMKIYQLTTGIIVCSILPISWGCLRIGLSPTSVFWISLFITIINQIVCLLVVKNKIFNFCLKKYIKQVIAPCFTITILTIIIPLVCYCFMESSLLRLCIVTTSSITIAIGSSYKLALGQSEKLFIKKFLQKFITHKN